MYRKLYDELLQWKVSPMRKPLILEGARQVGKTWLLRTFGENEYDDVVYINLDNNSTLKDVFEDYNTDNIIRSLSAISSKKITPDKTLIIFDEIQEIPKALGALKYFCEDLPEYHVAVAGSLLGITLHSGTSYPVGKVNILTLYPMDFEEFLLACDKSDLVEMIQNGEFDLLNPLSELLTDYLRQYYFVGGMPEAVKVYCETNDLAATRQVQYEILNTYKNDISKHAPYNQIPRINMVWNSIPNQLSKENKKFVYSALRGGARASEFEVAIQWLCDAGLVFKVHRVNKIAEPPKFYEDMNSFKLFMNDCGLYGALAETPSEKILIGKNIFSEYLGAFTEEYVATQLRCQSETGLFYYSKENSTLELDFLIYKNGRIIPTEVKASENLKAKSLKTVLASSPEIRGLRISMSPYRQEDRFDCLPLWAIGSINHSQ